jgi:hypothetical protein
MKLKSVRNAELKKVVGRYLKVLGLTDSATTAPKPMEDVQIGNLAMGDALYQSDHDNDLV